jgi:hypothetical protein
MNVTDMLRSFVLLAFAISSLTGLGSAAMAAGFTTGDLVLTRLDNGVNGLVNSGNSVHLDEFTTATGQTTPVLSIPFPTSGPDALVMSTTQTEGELRLSQDGTQLSVFGYNVATGGANDVRKLTNRTDIIGVAAANGTLSYPNTTVDAYNPLDAASHQIRGAYTTDDKNYYLSGDDSGNAPTQSGTRYLAGPGPGPTTSTAISTAAPQARFTTTGPDGNIYAYEKGGSGSYASAIVNLGNNPTSNNPSPAILLAAGTGSYAFNAVDAFAFVTFHTSPGFAPGDLLYLSDDGLGLLKYQYNGTTWMQDGFNTVSGNFSLGMTAVSDGTNVLLYAVQGTGGARLLSFDDTNAKTSTPAAFQALTQTVIATAPANDAFRGVSFAPTAAVPEPGSIVLAGMGLIGVGFYGWRRCRAG